MGRALHQGRGKGLEAWVAGELEAAERVGLLAYWARQEPPMRGIGGGKFAPKGGGPPDFLAVTQDGAALMVETKEHQGTRWRLDAVEPHQAAALSALPGSCVVVRWTDVQRTVALPWAVLGPLWSEHAGRTGRAKAGEGSLSLEQALALGVEVKAGAQALGHLLVDEAGRAWRAA